jgi:phage FluMu gp28-like protein
MSEEALPDVFLPYQQRLWRAVDGHQVVVVEKSRRTGFSWAVAAIAAEYAARARGAGGMDALYMGYEREMTREFIGYVADWAAAMQAAASGVEEFVFHDPDKPDTSVGAFRIRFASGFEVIALPSVARALRGKQGLVILDEAAFMDDLAGVLKAAMALLIWGGKVVVISTHDGEVNPFNALVVDIRAGRLPYALQRLTFDDAVAEGLYRRVCLRARREWTAAGEAAWVEGIRAQYRDNAAEELDVIPNPTTGTYLPAPLIEARSDASVPVLRWNAPAGLMTWPEELRRREASDWCREHLRPVLDALPRGEPCVLGEDFGRVRDLTVLWLLGIGRDLVRRTRVVVELRGVPFEQQRAVLWYLLDGLSVFRAAVMDAGGNGSWLAEVTLQRYGERVQPLLLSEPWYRENMPPFKAALEDGMLTLPADRDIHDDLHGLKLVRGVARVPERTRNDEGRSRHGDAAIAACLAYAASRADPEVYGYEPAGRVPAPDATRWSDRARDWEEDNLPAARRWLPTLRSRE